MVVMMKGVSLEINLAKHIGKGTMFLEQFKWIWQEMTTCLKNTHLFQPLFIHSLISLLAPGGLEHVCIILTVSMCPVNLNRIKTHYYFLRVSLKLCSEVWAFKLRQCNSKPLAFLLASSSTLQSAES